MNNSTKHNYHLEKKVQKIDATGISAGRLSTKIAVFLMGKNKAAYSPQTDCGDIVEVNNVDSLKWTGKKLDSREYIHFSGYPGGIKRKKVSDVYKNDPEEVVKRTVFNMLPKNKLRQRLMKRIKFV